MLLRYNWLMFIVKRSRINKKFPSHFSSCILFILFVDVSEVMLRTQETAFVFSSISRCVMI